MGSSGAGKSSLLDILAHRKTVGEVSGNVYLNHKPIFQHSSFTKITQLSNYGNVLMKRLIAYVMQENILFESLTVYENLYYAAKLRVSFPKNQKPTEVFYTKRVKQIMKLLGLSHIKDSLIGNERERGISGGQKKRVSIGVEIIHKPKIIMLDEPTSGLDSAISYEVMAVLRLIANQSRTVLCTIHQPSPQTYKLFDTLLLLAKGKVLYYGPAQSAVSYFLQSPYMFDPLVSIHNPGEFLISVAHGTVYKKPSSSNHNLNFDENNNSNSSQDISSLENVTFDELFFTFDQHQSFEARLHTILSVNGVDSINSSMNNATVRSHHTVETFSKSHVSGNSFYSQLIILMQRFILVRCRNYLHIVLSFIT
jgi:ABC-type multidrug transport system ATPase subunit